ncbi:MAG: 5-carboxymethyl-2-hydroxymuconate Delta-isomerase [Burkholderiales bacterium]|nr:5-carboxymethyl-2-hydroxymuconate Delta-isomerase [Burkholderiales bacterium]
MPHLVVEYSANLAAAGDIAGLMPKLARVLRDQRADGKAVYPIGGIRVRAYEARDYCVADGAPDIGFVHASLKVGAGRPAETLRATGDALFAVLKEHFAAAFAARGLAISLEVGEFSEAGTWKHNNLHARFART